MPTCFRGCSRGEWIFACRLAHGQRCCGWEMLASPLDFPSGSFQLCFSFYLFPQPAHTVSILFGMQTAGKDNGDTSLPQLHPVRKGDEVSAFLTADRPNCSCLGRRVAQEPSNISSVRRANLSHGFTGMAEKFHSPCDPSWGKQGCVQKRLSQICKILRGTEVFNF